MLNCYADDYDFFGHITKLGEGWRGWHEKEKEKSAELIVRSVSQLQNAETTKSLYVSKLFLGSENAKNYSPQKSIALDSSQNWRRKRKKEQLGQAVVFNLLMFTSIANPKRVLGVNCNRRFLEPI